MKITKITAAVLAALCIIPVIASAESTEDTFTENGIEYIINTDGTACVINIADKELTEVVIPEEIRNHKVTALGDINGAKVFEDCKRVKSVTIPASVTSIGHFCFYNVGSLKDVYYAGTGEQWRKMFIGMQNNGLSTAEFHFDAGEPDIEDIPDLTVAGDVDCDGIITAKDATAVLKHVVQLKILEGEAYANADANGDGTINAKDATQILKIVVGLA